MVRVETLDNLDDDDQPPQRSARQRKAKKTSTEVITPEQEVQVQGQEDEAVQPEVRHQVYYNHELKKNMLDEIIDSNHNFQFCS